MNLFGRRVICTTTEDITQKNVVAELERALSVHAKNAQEEDYLYWYRRGKQPVRNRKKQIRPEINNKVTENHAGEIVAFKNGYFLTQPAYYVGRRGGAQIGEKIERLNEYLYMSGKTMADNALADWFHTVGVGILHVQPNADEIAPVKVQVLDPRCAFVAYSPYPGHKPVMGVNIVSVCGADGRLTKIYDVFTEKQVFRIVRGGAGANEVRDAQKNEIGRVPLVEYQYDANRMGSFESVITMLDAINETQSNRMDGIAQFIQSLMIFYNCQLGDDESGNQITPALIRESGAIFLKSIGQDKADLKILSEQLNQTQTQVMIDDMYEQAMAIAGVPVMKATKASTSDNVGAVYLRSGWGTADTLARNTEDLFKESNRLFDEIFLGILRVKTDLDLNLSDIELKFTRNEMNNMLVKTQAALNLKSLGLSPEIVLGRSGVSNDPVGDVAKSQPYIDAAFGTQEASSDRGEAEQI